MPGQQLDRLGSDCSVDELTKFGEVTVDEMIFHLLGRWSTRALFTWIDVVGLCLHGLMW